MWRTTTRFDHGYMDRVLAPGFFEFGRSGRVYERSASLGLAAREIRARLPLDHFELHEVADGVVLATYDSEVGGEPTEFAHRSSLWRRTSTGWQLLFHQGTPFEPS